MSQLQTQVEEFHSSVVCITETWLREEDDQHLKNLILPPGFEGLYQDRTTEEEEDLLFSIDIIFH